MPFTFVTGPSQVIRDYGVTVQSTKFGITPDGVISYRRSYGISSAEVWRERLRALAGG